MMDHYHCAVAAVVTLALLVYSYVVIYRLGEHRGRIDEMKRIKGLFEEERERLKHGGRLNVIE